MTLKTRKPTTKIVFTYTQQLIMDECKTFFFAGHDTSSLLLTWTIMLLATNPSWQERARNEVLQVCDQSPLSIDHLSKFTLCWPFITARSYGEKMQMSSSQKGFAGKSFAQTRNFLPFASGPRNCVGQAFAIMEAKIILAMLLSNFSFRISENYRHAPVNVLTLKPKYGVPVYLKAL
ncbi:putative cytochrome P450 [Dioscorea sansibarensis]